MPRCILLLGGWLTGFMYIAESIWHCTWPSGRVRPTRRGGFLVAVLAHWGWVHALGSVVDAVDGQVRDGHGSGEKEKKSQTQVVSHNGSLTPT